MLCWLTGCRCEWRPSWEKGSGTVNFCRHQCFTSLLSTGNRVQRSSEGMRVFSFELEHSAFSVFLPRIITALLASNLLNELDISQHLFGISAGDDKSHFTTWTIAFDLDIQSELYILTAPNTEKEKEKKHSKYDHELHLSSLLLAPGDLYFNR